MAKGVDFSEEAMFTRSGAARGKASGTTACLRKPIGCYEQGKAIPQESTDLLGGRGRASTELLPSHPTGSYTSAFAAPASPTSFEHHRRRWPEQRFPVSLSLAQTADSVRPWPP